MRQARYKKRKTDIGELRTPVSFFEHRKSGPYPSDRTESTKLFYCLAEIHNPSMKDMELMKSAKVDKSVTIRIRDPLQDYRPRTNHFVEIHDFRYEGILWNIENVRPSHDDDRIIIIVLGATA